MKQVRKPVPRIPSERDLQGIRGAKPEDIVDWMAGLQKRIAKTAAQPKPATERGAEIRALAGTLEEVTVEMARRFMVEKEGYPEKGVHPFGPVLDVDDKTVIIPAGARTVDEQSKLHGAEIAKRIIRPAIEGQSDLLELIKDLDRIRGKE